jgi:5-methylcytosine-specific restriction protein A
VSDKRERNGQTIVATTLGGKGLTMRVRLCWRCGSGGRDSTRVRTYSGTQLLAHIKNDDPEQSLHAKIEREKSHGVTHFLFVQRDGERIVYAALVPLEKFLAIWCDERDISARLI